MKKLCLFIYVLCFVSIGWSQVEDTKKPQKPSPGLPQRQVAAGVAGKQTPLPMPPEQRLPLEYGKLPMSFEANQGQTGSPVKFLARGPGYTFFFSSSEAVLMLRKPADEQTRLMQGLAKPGTLWLDAAIVRLKLLRGNPSPAIEGQDELPGKSNYFIGNDPKKWRTDVPNYARVRYRQVYPGVDVEYHGYQTQLEQDFIVAAGADPTSITLHFDSAEKVSLDAQGDLVLDTRAGALRFRKPAAYQQIEGQPKNVPSGYVLKGGNAVGFEVGAHDTSKPLVIDPVVAYSTAFGGSSYDEASGIAVDSSGNAYLTGLVDSTDFPTVNPVRPAFSGINDAFVAKLNAAGNALVYSTYLGGRSSDEGFGIAVDSSGGAYVTGVTYSTDFPTVNPIQPAFRGYWTNAFVAKLNAAGNALVYSTYLGGSGDDGASGIAVDSSGNAYVAGATSSIDFPTANAFQPTNAGFLWNAFVAKLNAAGNALVYSTYLGGSGNDFGYRIAVDASGSAYVTGEAWSTDFPTVNPIQRRLGGGPGFSDAFVTKLNAAGNALVYSTYLGGSSYDAGYAIAVDSSGSAYVTGFTDSTDFPTVNPVQNAVPPSTPPPFRSDAFVTKLDPAVKSVVSVHFVPKEIAFRCYQKLVEDRSGICRYGDLIRPLPRQGRSARQEAERR